nr:hypothetical protein [Spodoptera litura nucleopolyhedrovirus]
MTAIYIVLVIVLTVCFVTMLFVLRTNRQHVEKILYYQYNYIPKPLISLVKVYKLK